MGCTLGKKQDVRKADAPVQSKEEEAAGATSSNVELDMAKDGVQEKHTNKAAGAKSIGSMLPASGRYEIYFSHIKGRGGMFMQGGTEYFLVFHWAGMKEQTKSTPGSTNRRGCSWDQLIHFSYKRRDGLEYSDSITTMNDESLTGSSSEQLLVECYGMKKHNFRDNETWKVGSFSVDLTTVMSGPVHHVFVLTPEGNSNGSPGDISRLSYNCRITQYSHWRLNISRLTLEYDDPTLGEDASKKEGSGSSGVGGSSKSLAPSPLATTETRKLRTISEVNQSSGKDLDSTIPPMETETKAEKPGIAPSLLKLAAVESMRKKGFKEDRSSRFLVRYHMNKPDSDEPVNFESRSVFPRLDALGLTYMAEMDHSILPTIDEKLEHTFRSFLASSVAFHIYRIRWEEGGTRTPPDGGTRTPPMIAESSEGGSTTAIPPKPMGITASARQDSYGKELSSLEGLDSYIVTNKRAHLVGECYVPVDQLFELATEESAVGTCYCFPSEDGQQHAASVYLEKELRIYGRRVGVLRLTMCFERLPAFMQLGTGVLTEDGVTLVSPYIMQQTDKPTFMQKMLGGNSTELLSSPNCKKLRQAIETLENTLKAPRKQIRGRAEHNTLHNEYIRSCKALLTALNTSEKESMVCFVYKSDQELFLMQQTLGRLWKVLLEGLDAVMFSVRILFFEIMVALIKRGEMGEYMVQGWPSENEKASGVDADETLQEDLLKFAFEYRGLCYRTLSWVLNKLSTKGSFIELRVFCARIVAIMSFRLPKFGTLVYQAIVPEDETTVKEWVESKALRPMLTSGEQHFQTPEWHSSRYTLEPGSMLPPDTTTSPSGSSATKGRFPRDEANEQLLNWKPFHRYLEKKFEKKKLEAQESVLPMGTKKNGVFQPPLWLRRTQKHGLFFTLYSQEWIIYVLDTIGSLASSSTDNFEGRKFKSGIRWHKIPGYKHILKAFLLELRRREHKELSESMRKLSMLLLVDPELITPFVNIIIPKTNIYDLENVTTTIDIMSAWFTATHGWPGRFIAAKVFRGKGPFTALEADIALSKVKSHFFASMLQYQMEKKEEEQNRINREESFEDKDSLFSKSNRELNNQDSGNNSSSSSSNNNNNGTAAENNKNEDDNDDIDVSPPPAPLVQLRAAGTLSNTPGKQTAQKYATVNNPVVNEKPPEPYVSAWDFDSVSVYFPHLDIVRREFRKGDAVLTPQQKEVLGITQNNDRSKCNWYSHIYADTPPLLPSTFDFKLLAHALWVLLHADHFQVILKTLEFLYNQWESFPVRFQNRIREMMLATSAENFVIKERLTTNKQSLLNMETLDSISSNDMMRDGTCLFISLFFHWQEETRYFFQTFLAYRLCRGDRESPAHKRLLAAVRISLLSTEDGIWEKLWGNKGGSADRSKLMMKDVGPETLQTQFLVGKRLVKTFEQQPTVEETGRERSPSGRWLGRRKNSKQNITSDREAEDMEDIISNTRSIKVLANVAEDVSKQAQNRRAKQQPEEKQDPNQKDSNRAEWAMKEIQKDLPLVGDVTWPFRLRPYAIAAVTKFKTLWRNSLKLEDPLPHLEWSVVVMDKGEMRSIGGLAHFSNSASFLSSSY